MNVRALLFALALAGATRLDAQGTSALPRSTPERQGVSSAGILGFVQAADTAVDAMNSFMLVRHGKVVAEGWWTPYDATTRHVLYSLSKSFTSTAVGLAIADGKLSLDDQVLKFFPEDAPSEPSANLRAMRVRDLLRMSAGHQTEAALFGGEPAERGEPLTKAFLAHPVPFKPGTHFLYNSPATYMLSAMVQKATGKTVLEYLRPRLFDPLGIENPIWFASAQGISFGAFGLMVRTEDIARMGQLYLQKGMWKGRQIVPAAWVTEATARQTSNGSSPTSDWDQGYGYQFWQSRHGYRGDGAFGQYMLVLPEQDAVVAITSGVRDMQQVMELVWTKLLPAMSSRPLPESPSAQRALKTKLAALSVGAPAVQSTSTLATQVSQRWYDVPENNRAIRSIALDFTSGRAALLVRTAAGEIRTAIGVGTWSKSDAGFTNGIERMLSVPAKPTVAASGAWTSDSVFTLKLVAPETPFYSTMTFRFEGDRLALDGEYNVALGQNPKLPRLEGKRAGSSDNPGAASAFVFVGGGDGKITRFALDEQTGALTQRTAFDGGQGTSFLAVAPDGKTMFAVNETQQGEVSSFAIQPGTGDLKFLSRTSSGGSGPAHLSVDHTGRWLFTANYGGGTSAVIPIRVVGTLGAPTSAVASGGKSHYITVSPDNRFVLVACLEPNHVAQYRLDASAGTLTPNSPAVLTIPGTKPGPRHLAFHPNGKLAFLMNELNSTVTSLKYDPTNGLLSVIQTVSALPSEVAGNTGAEIQVHPNGRFVYTSNRGHNSIAVFSVDQTTGRLTLIGTTPTGGRTPRHFSLNESGTMLFVANQNSGNVVAMRVNADGTLAPLGEAATGLASPEFVSVVRVPPR